MMRMRTTLLIAALLFARAVSAGGLDLLAGAYLDTLNSANLKVGMALAEPYDYDPERPYFYGGFHYADVEYGLKGAKISLGVGQHIGHGADRIGLSFARLAAQDLAGVEAVVSQMGLSLKAGYYLGLDGTDDAFLLGVGLGL